MARTKTKNGADAAPMTTSQVLGSLLKSARYIMRKDKGLNGDLDRLPLLTWIMFLKFLDDLEIQREDETQLAGKKLEPVIEPAHHQREQHKLLARGRCGIETKKGNGRHRCPPKPPPQIKEKPSQAATPSLQV